MENDNKRVQSKQDGQINKSAKKYYASAKKYYVMEILTFIMIVVTAISTFKTAEATKFARETFYAERRPYIVLDGVHREIINNTKPEDTELLISFDLHNTGKSITEYELTKFNVTIDNFKAEEVINPNPGTENLVLFPDQNTNLQYNLFRGVDTTKTIEATFEYEITYYSKVIKDAKYTSYKKGKLTISPNGDIDVHTINENAT